MLVSVKSKAPVSYAVLAPSSKANWIIPHKSSLLAWSDGLKVQSQANFFPTFKSKWANIKVSGNGSVAIVGQGQIFQMEVLENETISLNPGSILAYADNAESEPSNLRAKLSRLPHSNINFELPFLRSLRSSGVWSRLRGSAVFRAFSVLSSWLKTVTTRFIWRDDILLQLSGPTTVLIQAKASSLDEIITKEELQRIAKN